MEVGIHHMGAIILTFILIFMCSDQNKGFLMTAFGILEISTISMAVEDIFKHYEVENIWREINKIIFVVNFFSFRLGMINYSFYRIFTDLILTKNEFILMVFSCVVFCLLHIHWSIAIIKILLNYNPNRYYQSKQTQELNDEQQSSDVEPLIKIELQQPTLSLEAADDRQQLFASLGPDDLKQLEHQLGC